MKPGSSSRQQAFDDYRQKLFVVGPSSELTVGTVSPAQLAKWKSYLQREGQPLLSCQTDVNSILRVKKLSLESGEIKHPAAVAAAPEPVFRLEYYDPGVEEPLIPDEVTWEMYFREVHGVETDPTTDLALALQMAGWTSERIAQYAGIELGQALEEDCPEHKEFIDQRIELAKGEDVYIGPYELAFALIQSLTGSFPTECPPGNLVGRLELRPAPKGVHEVLAVGELTLTALQELFNTLQNGIRVQFWRESDPPSWSESFWDKLKE